VIHVRINRLILGLALLAAALLVASESHASIRTRSEDVAIGRRAPAEDVIARRAPIVDLAMSESKAGWRARRATDLASWRILASAVARMTYAW